MSNLLNGHNFSLHAKPKKLIVLLHGYGDNANNFLYLANAIDKEDWKAYYIALNAPEIIPNYPTGNQWFDLYPNGIYITEAGPNEFNMVRNSILCTVEKIRLTINFHLHNLELSLKDCILLGFSQGGMMTFEVGNYYAESLGGLAILSSQIIEQKIIKNESLKKTPIFISHGDQDNILDIDNFYQSINYLKKNNCNFESHELKGDTHTISTKAIHLLQQFIIKNI